MNTTSVRLWSSCLEDVPNSRLILQSDVFTDASAVRRIKDAFSYNGVDGERIECRPFAPHPHLFDTYCEIDIALDPHPYSGCLTTCEALWMGVPVVSLPGPTFAGRHTASFLTAVGLPDWIASNEEVYVDLVKDRVADLNSLAALRQGLRAQVAQSSLCDEKQFAADLEVALFDMWKRKQDGATPVV